LIFNFKPAINAKARRGCCQNPRSAAAFITKSDTPRSNATLDPGAELPHEAGGNEVMPRDARRI
jgi:hypothetical protein